MKWLSLMMKRAILLAISSVSFCFVYSQDLPSVIPPSPDASLFSKYLEYPVSNSTGIPDINIPLYTVKSGSLSLPISLNYHAAGRKVTDITGAVGLGWTLNAGGMISRTVHGLPDDGLFQFPMTIKTSYDITNENDFNVLTAIERSLITGYWYDSKYDIFSYLYPGGSGNFILKDNSNVKVPMTIPDKAIKINAVKDLTPNIYRFQYIEITGEDGTLYRYGKSLITGSLNAEFFGGSGPGVISSWMLSEIISANKADTISFTYTAFNKPDNIYYHSIAYRDFYTGNFYGLNPDPYTNPTDYQALQYYDIEHNRGEQVNYTPSGYTYLIERLSEIKFRNGKIVFVLQSGSDVYSNMTLYNSNNLIIKNIKFTQSVLDNPGPLATSLTHTLVPVKKLDKVSFKDNANSAIENYSFDYYPGVGSADDRKNQDLWGYYSPGSSTMPTISVPAMSPFSNYEASVPSPYTATLTTGIRYPAGLNANAGILKKITYPTGGTTEFIFESNSYKSSDGSIKNGGGLRIGQIKSYSEGNLQNIKTYKYGINECGYGTIPFEPDVKYLVSSDKRYYDNTSWSRVDGYSNRGAFRERIALSSFPEDINYLVQKPIGYEEVNEYIGDGQQLNSGKNMYIYDVKKYIISQYSPVLAPFSLYINTNLLLQPNLYFIQNLDMWSGNYLKEKNTYLFNAGSYNLLQNELYSYRMIDRESAIGLCVNKYAEPYGGSDDYFKIMAMSYRMQVMNAYNYYITSGYQSLDAVTIKEYHGKNPPTITTTNYAYNNNHFISKKTLTSSNLDVLTTDIKYPPDYTGNATLTQMVNLNMLNLPVEQIDTKNTATPVKSVRTNYYDWSTTANPMIAPLTVDVKQGLNGYETRLQYQAYDNSGNPTSVSKENGVLNTYLWGYNNAYPIAEVKNAKSNEIFFESFEEGNGWDANLTAYDNIQTHTGNYSGKIDKPTSGELYATCTKWLNVLLTAPTKFHYSGWIYSNGPSAEIFFYMKKAGEAASYSYTDNILTTVTGKWVFVEKDFTVPADVISMTLRVDNNGGTGGAGTVWFDDLRLHPTNAYMTTYTYKPLIGTTSRTDENNQTTYYEYDTYQRLKLLKDFKGNILKTFKYQLVNP